MVWTCRELATECCSKGIEERSPQMKTGRIGRTAGVMLLSIFIGFQVMVWVNAAHTV